MSYLGCNISYGNLCIINPGINRLHKEFFIREGKESSQSSIKTRQSFTSHLELKLGAKDCDPITGELNLEEVVVPKSTVQITSILDQILDTSYANNSFESCKLKTYIRECWDVQDIDDEFPTGVHPDRYQEFVGGLTQYIVDKQLLLQRESLTYDIVHVSHHFPYHFSPFNIRLKVFLIL